MFDAIDPMDRRDFLWRLWIGAAFACASIPLLGDVAREWARTKQHERSRVVWVSKNNAERKRAMAAQVRDSYARASYSFNDQHRRHWTASVPAEAVQVRAGYEHRQT